MVLRFISILVSNFLGFYRDMYIDDTKMASGNLYALLNEGRTMWLDPEAR